MKTKTTLEKMLIVNKKINILKIELTQLYEKYASENPCIKKAIEK